MTTSTASFDPRVAAVPLTPQEQHVERAVQAFTRLGAAPRPTFPLALASVTVATVAMHSDYVARYSLLAFWVGIAATLALALVVGHAVSVLATPRGRMVASLVLPTASGAVVGMIVQAVVLAAIGSGDSLVALKDLGGLVDSTEPVSWILAGIVLGAPPALAVAVFLALAARALRRLVGNDAAEGFGVAFTGFAGLLATCALAIVEPWEMVPLFVVVLLASLSVLCAFLVDGARLEFLRHVWSGIVSGDNDHRRTTYDVAPADRFRQDPSIAQVVARLGQRAAPHVLVRVDRHLGSYRSAAAEPIALIADTETETTRPLRRRRFAAAAVLLGIATGTTLALAPYADHF